nr:hypothetical protein Iba_chr02bCG16830 [Ipomoea batatas]
MQNPHCFFFILIHKFPCAITAFSFQGFALKTSTCCHISVAESDFSSTPDLSECVFSTATGWASVFVTSESAAATLLEGSAVFSSVSAAFSFSGVASTVTADGDSTEPTGDAGKPVFSSVSAAFSFSGVASTVTDDGDSTEPTGDAGKPF